MWPLVQQYQNGIRTDVADIYNPGPFQDFDAALQSIRALLDEAKGDLENAGSSFDFSIKMGFGSPADMIEVNRAIAARAALYAEDYTGALNALNESFIDFNVDDTEGGRARMNIGPVHVYGNDPDINNPLFYQRNAATNTILIVHPAMIEDMLPGDARGDKFFERNTPVTSGSFPYLGEYQDNRLGHQHNFDHVHP
ncbi:MAG: RagB/SusD family nutrient uptake outer membrane protein, partial [Bacteroidia bacterium]|nr:RagB/SusD family nutrient uptake outer membrane protein [Bacteroidia bacterium]